MTAAMLFLRDVRLFSAVLEALPVFSGPPAQPYLFSYADLSAVCVRDLKAALSSRSTETRLHAAIS